MNKMGFVRTYARSIVFGPKDYGGIGCLDLRIEAGFGAIETIARHLRTPGHGQFIISVFLINVNMSAVRHTHY